MKKTIQKIGLIYALLLILSPIHAQDKPEGVVDEYRIGPRDLLEIKVFELPELDQTVRVSEDGSITLPLLKKVYAEGLTKDQLETKIADMLKPKYVKNAQVSIFIKEYQSQRVSIIGAIENPGMYELSGQNDLLQIISKAGGLTENAMDNIYIMRKRENGQTETLLIGLNELLYDGNQYLNIPLYSDDIINIPFDQLFRIYVFGEVTNPGALEFKMSEEITILKAIAQAGGLTEDAKEKRVIVMRKNNEGIESKIKVNLVDIIKGQSQDIILQKGDIVFVPESSW